MAKPLFLTFSLFFLLLTSCGEVEYSDKTPRDGDSVMVEVIDFPDVSLEDLDERVERRRAAGDTVAREPGVMERTIRKKIQGYELEIDEAETFETKRFAFSEATKVFYNAAGDV